MNTRVRARDLYTPGRRFRVIREGARLSGMVPIRGGYQGWGRLLAVGEIITCRGFKMGWGSDNIPCVEWESDGAAFVHLLPDVGTWQPWPKDGYLEPVEETDE